MRRVRKPQRSFADLELERQGVAMEAVLSEISRLLDRRGANLLAAVAQDLSRGLKSPQKGRDSMSAEQVLRSLVLKQIKNWPFRELRERIADGITLREFTRFGATRVPEFKAFHRASARLTANTLVALNELVVDIAIALGVEDVRKVRIDTTVSETNIHFPTDSMLLWDTVRVLTRSAERIVEEVPGLRERFFNRTRAARRRMQEIQRMTRSERAYLQEPKYRELIKITNQVIHNARAVAKAAQAVMGLRVLVACDEIRHYAALGERVVAQARRRVIEGQSVSADQKLYSIFEPHTDLIKRGKAQKPVEFGHKVFLVESRRGLIVDYRVLDGNPTDDSHVEQWLKRHIERFACAPKVVAGDRGFFSRANIERLRTTGVELECLPQRGGKKTPERAAYEKSRPFKEGQKFRAGIEGRISVLMRGRGMKRCLWKGKGRFDLFIGIVVLTNNLMMIGRHLAQKQKRQQPLAA